MSCHNTCMAGLKFIVQQWLANKIFRTYSYIVYLSDYTQCLYFEFKKFWLKKSSEVLHFVQ